MVSFRIRGSRIVRPLPSFHRLIVTDGRPPHRDYTSEACLCSTRLFPAQGTRSDSRRPPPPPSDSPTTRIQLSCYLPGDPRECHDGWWAHGSDGRHVWEHAGRRGSRGAGGSTGCQEGSSAVAEAEEASYQAQVGRDGMNVIANCCSVETRRSKNRTNESSRGRSLTLGDCYVSCYMVTTLYYPDCTAPPPSHPKLTLLILFNNHDQRLDLITTVSAELTTSSNLPADLHTSPNPGTGSPASSAPAEEPVRQTQASDSEGAP